MAVEGIGGVDAEQFLERGGVEVVVAGDGDAFARGGAGPGRTLKTMTTSLCVGGLLLVIHLDVEVAEALIVVAQPAIALVEQILVDAALFKDGNDALDAFRADACALRRAL